jgi:hypothetical protein
MDSPNRINPLAVTPSVQRQTPKDEFGQVLSQTLSTGVHTATAVLSAAVRGDVTGLAAKGLEAISARASVATSGPGQAEVRSAVAVAGGSPAGGQVAGAGAGAGGGWDLLEAQRAMQADSQSFQLQYLKLQEDMQRESREYNTLSNVMKARHDSAKAAINNIR